MKIDFEDLYFTWKLFWYVKVYDFFKKIPISKDIIKWYEVNYRYKDLIEYVNSLNNTKQDR